MLRALREIMDEPGVVPMRIGVNTGKVFTGDFGPPYRRSYRVFGDAINTAARVMSKAEPGQVLARKSSSGGLAPHSRCPDRAVRGQGEIEPIRASAVGPIVGVRAAELDATPMFGRERELGRFGGSSTTLAVRTGSWTSRGMAGTGKTRLLKALLEIEPDVHVFHSRCEQYNGDAVLPL